MKRFLATMFALFSLSFAWAAPASLTRAKQTHAPVQRHRAHKATRHHAPRRHRHKT